MRRLTIVGICLVVIALVIVYFSKTSGKQEINNVAGPPPPVISLRSDPFISELHNPHWDSLLGDYDSYIRNAIDRNLAAGAAVVVMKDTSIYFMRAYGISDYGTGDSTGIHTIFRLGSVSKCFASVLTARLVERGVLSWDDKVTKFLPGFRLSSNEYTEQLTIRHLLSHTSGLPYHAFTDRIDDGANLDTLIYHLRDLKLTGPPGKMYSYQNVAYSITSKALEAATGKTYEALMDEEIFNPLDMLEASMTFNDLVNDKRKAKPHIYSRKGWKALPISETYYNAAPAGGINASICDMARFVQALNGGNRLLSESTRRDIFKPYIKATARNRNFRRWKRSTGSYYGLGWRVLTFKDDTLNYHGGYVNGFRAEVAIEKQGKIAICVLVNSAGPLADNAIPEFFIRYEKRKSKIDEWEARGLQRAAP
jgi:beta-lactamase class C